MSPRVTFVRRRSASSVGQPDEGTLYMIVIGTDGKRKTHPLRTKSRRV
jgi:hypothetical protein